MPEIEITPLEAHVFGVRVTAGNTVTNHRVRVPQGVVDDLGLGDVEADVLVRESFAFLLEREPATSILREFALSDYPDEIRRRMQA